jgi:hypothetical protein
MLGIYLWLRFDPVIWLAFRNDWRPRHDFMSNMFGEKDTDIFFIKRGKLVEKRRKKHTPILPSHVNKLVAKFLAISTDTKKNLQIRAKIIEKLLFWVTDSEINRTNINSYQTRTVIVEALLGSLFQNALSEETDLILENFNKIVFSRITYIGSKGEQSPIVHDAIISGVGRVLTSHFNEITRLRDEKLEKLTVIKMIKEIQKAKKDTGSLAFSADIDRKGDQFRNKYPLSNNQAKSLFKILKHYQFSAWPDSRAEAVSLLESMEKQLGFDLSETFN